MDICDLSGNTDRNTISLVYFMAGGQTGFGHKERQDALLSGRVTPFPQCSDIPACQLTGSMGSSGG